MLNNTHIFRLLLLLLVSLVLLSGCILVPVDDGYNRGGSRGGYHGDRYDGHRDRR